MTTTTDIDSLRNETVSCIEALDAVDWNSLVDDDFPFLKFEFLRALERNACASTESGWRACHYLLYRGEKLIAAAPRYIKTHSYGEYVFDWAWANAYEENGLRYYPKLLCAIPFTPCVGPRLMTGHGENFQLLCRRFSRDCIAYCRDENLSSSHILFPNNPLGSKTNDSGFVTRIGAQFHWYNHDYCTFDDFLVRFSSRKRKAVKKERRAIAEAGLICRWVEGGDLGSDELDRFYACYQATYLKKSGSLGYLNKAFFEDLAQSMPKNICLLFVESQQEVIAASFFVKGNQTLYGRYWGCLKEFEYLHFEACYYQGIEYCIKHGLKHFDAGAQGEHKVLRGFEPIETYSFHWIAHMGFRSAIEDFLEREQDHVKQYIAAAAARLPFKNQPDK